MAESRGIKIFLGHASDDKTAVLSLYERLKDQGYDPWLDTKNLLPGQNWRTEIPKAIKSCDVFIACLSPHSVNKDGYIQQELRIALMVCAQKPSDSLYLIPLRLEACRIPDLQLPQLGVNLRDYHWLDYWESDSFERLVQSIEHGHELSPFYPAASAVPSPPSVPLAPSIDNLQRFSFEVVTVDSRGQETDRKASHGNHFLENLGDGVLLDMVWIPGGEFMMGSPQDEPERRTWEGPQHHVIVPEFFIGRYPVTQAQWRVVAGLEQVNRELMVDPSRFRGSNRPVENVSWRDAVEFCTRLSCLSRYHYHLPSESQWEYCCRGGTMSPFHFGWTVTSEIANYAARSAYGDGPKGKYRRQTTEVGYFPANNFGLHDLHGNVMEWCQDHWHRDYVGAPTDGSAWVYDNDYCPRVIRGGSWLSTPWQCRSAFRLKPDPDFALEHLGFRVVCSALRT